MGALGDPYITLPELKTYLSIDPAKLSMDERLLNAANSASREIEQFCGRQFNKATAATARSFEPASQYVTHVDDFHTTEGLIIEIDYGGGNFGLPLSSSEYKLLPYNGIVDGQPGWPYSRIRLRNTWFPYHGRRYLGDRGEVRVTAQWGWTAVPSSVKQACFLLAAQTFKLADAPFGVAGMDQFGGVVRVRDLPQVASKLNRFVSTPIMVG